MLTVETARQWANKALAVADLIAQMTPFTVDDDIIRRGRRLVDSDPFLEVAVDGFNLLWSLFNKSGETITAQDVEVLKAKIAEAKGATGSFGS